MRILYFHIPVLEPYMLPTSKMMKELLYDWNVRVIDIATPKNENRMYEGLCENWGIEDIIIFGQDNTCPISQLGDLTYCNQPICAIPCLMHTKSTGLKGEYLNQISDGKLHAVDDTRPFCTGIVGTGISKITLEVQKEIDITKEPFHYQNFDATLSKLFHRAGYNKFHLHYPLHEHHKK